MDAPSAFLPVIAPASSLSAEQLTDALDRLGAILNPSVIKSAHSQHNASDLTDLSADSFERAHAVRWLTGLIARLSLSDDRDQSHLVERASSLLAACSGSSAQGAAVHTFLFGRGTGAFSVHIRDAAFDSSDPSGVALGLQTWGSARVLAECIASAPEAFGLGSTSERILELGAGTGLVSLLLARILDRSDAPEKCAIVATDYHPAVLKNLEGNLELNAPHRVPLIACELDWSTDSAPNSAPALAESFDLIVAADVVYELQQCSWVKTTVERLLRRSTHAYFHLVMPNRPKHEQESCAVSAAFPAALSEDALPAPSSAACALPSTAELRALTVRKINTHGSTLGSVEEYWHYQIGWVASGR